MFIKSNWEKGQCASCKRTMFVSPETSMCVSCENTHLKEKLLEKDLIIKQERMEKDFYKSELDIVRRG